MLTRCPQCATVFRVSPQQLKVHQGEVRCGRCSTIFDAFDSLVAEPGATAAAAGSTAAPESVTGSANTETVAAQKLESRRKHPRPATTDDSAPAADVDDSAWAIEPGPRRRWPWAVLGVLAAIALAGQATYQYRAEVAVLWPEARPSLERACVELRCTVALPRHVELVSIDASDLQIDPAHANLMILTATLKNRAPFGQEHPALALTLTDTRDQPLVRRVLAPADYLERKTDGKAGLAANAELAIKVFVDSREVKAAGYRLFVFYP